MTHFRGRAVSCLIALALVVVTGVAGAQDGAATEKTDADAKEIESAGAVTQVVGDVRIPSLRPLDTIAAWSAPRTGATGVYFAMPYFFPDWRKLAQTVSASCQAQNDQSQQRISYDVEFSSEEYREGLAEAIVAEAGDGKKVTPKIKTFGFTKIRIVDTAGDKERLQTEYQPNPTAGAQTALVSSLGSNRFTFELVATCSELRKIVVDHRLLKAYLVTELPDIVASVATIDTTQFFADKTFLDIDNDQACSGSVITQTKSLDGRAGFKVGKEFGLGIGAGASQTEIRDSRRCWVTANVLTDAAIKFIGSQNIVEYDDAKSNTQTLVKDILTQYWQHLPSMEAVLTKRSDGQYELATAQGDPKVLQSPAAEIVYAGSADNSANFKDEAEASAEGITAKTKGETDTKANQSAGGTVRNEARPVNVRLYAVGTTAGTIAMQASHAKLRDLGTRSVLPILLPTVDYRILAGARPTLAEATKEWEVSVAARQAGAAVGDPLATLSLGGFQAVSDRRVDVMNDLMSRGDAIALDSMRVPRWQVRPMEEVRAQIDTGVDEFIKTLLGELPSRKPTMGWSATYPKGVFADVPVMGNIQSWFKIRDKQLSDLRGSLKNALYAGLPEDVARLDATPGRTFSWQFGHGDYLVLIVDESEYAALPGLELQAWIHEKGDPAKVFGKMAPVQIDLSSYPYEPATVTGVKTLGDRGGDRKLRYLTVMLPTNGGITTGAARYVPPSGKQVVPAASPPPPAKKK